MPQNTPRETPKQSNGKRPGDGNLFVLAMVLIFASFLMMGAFARTVQKTDDEQFWEFAAMFNEVYKEISERYVDEVDSKKLFEGALQGMFLTLDPHSQYMDPDVYSQLEKDTEGAFSGIGTHITIKDGVLTIIAPMPGSPAARAGVKAWDRIIEIDGKKTEGITIIEAVKKLTGPSGTTVNIKVYREGQRDFLTFNLVRKSIKVESIYSKMLEGSDVGYARITKFSDNTSRDLRKAVETLIQEGAKGIVVDLRFNTGGLLKEAVDVSNIFLPRGKLVVSTKGRMKNQTQELRAESDPVTDMPLIILINKSSASASEIFAGAMKDHNRGVVLGIKGQNSFGKGSVQTIEELAHSFEKDDNGNYRPAALRLTTAKYYMPNGTSIDKKGVVPDIAVDLPKGNEDALARKGLFGDPVTEEDDGDTTKSVFNWKEGNGKLEANDKATTAADATNANDSTTSGDAEEDDGLLFGSAAKKDEAETTAPKPRRVIPIDFKLFPDAKTSETLAAEEAAKPKNGEFVDYQLEVAKRLMEDHLTKGLDFYAPEAGMREGMVASEVTETTATAAAGTPAVKPE